MISQVQKKRKVYGITSAHYLKKRKNQRKIKGRYFIFAHSKLLLKRKIIIMKSKYFIIYIYIFFYLIIYIYIKIKIILSIFFIHKKNLFFNINNMKFRVIKIQNLDY